MVFVFPLLLTLLRCKLAMGTTSCGVVRYKFTGKERDSETGLDYMGARYYANSQGRFTTPDPLSTSARLQNPQTLNRYAYVHNNPLSFIDPLGLLDYFVFRPTANDGDTSWNDVQVGANDTLTVLNGSNATAELYSSVLQDQDAAVVFIGHGVEDFRGRTASVLTSDGAVGDFPIGQFNVFGIGDGTYATAYRLVPNGDGTPGSVATDPVAVSNLNANSVGVFTCNSVDLQSQYAPAPFTGVNSGTDQKTALSTLDSAGKAYTQTLLNGGTLPQARTAANTAVTSSKVDDPKNPDPKVRVTDKDGDHVVPN